MPKRTNSDTTVLETPKRRKRKLTPNMVCAADHPAEKVKWLWPGRIPIGKVTLLAGDPGNGKSLLTIDITSRVSRGAAWPDENSQIPLPVLREGLGEGSSNSPGSVLILTIEDDLADTIRPRLDAAGADPSRVFILKNIDDLRHDMDKLRDAVDAAPDCRLIIIDSINAFVGPGDSHFHTIVRRVFRPLAELAAEYNLAVLAVSHFRKSEGAAITRTTGSMGFVAASRAVWTVCRDKTQRDRHLMLSMKNNFVADSTGLAFRIESVPTPTGTAPAIAWQPGAVTSTTQEALDRENKPKTEEESELNLAAAWLREVLADGPKPSLYIFSEGTVQGDFAQRTLRRALESLGGRTRKSAFYGEWIWELPDQTEIQETKSETTEVPAEDTPETLAPWRNVGPLGKKQASAWPLRTMNIEKRVEEFEDFDSPPWDGPTAEARPATATAALDAFLKQLSDPKFATKPPPT